MGGPEMAPQTPQRSAGPGEAGARLDPALSVTRAKRAGRLDALTGL
jgi:hypothetical protein